MKAKVIYPQKGEGARTTMMNKDIKLVAPIPFVNPEIEKSL